MNPHTTSSLLPILRAGWDNSFYRNLWKQHGITSAEDLSSIASAAHFRELPIIRKSDLKENGDSIMCWDGASDVVSSSGTTGRPVDIPVLFEEEKNRVDRVRKTIREVGVTQNSRVLQLLSLNDMFALGPQMWLAIKAEGALAIRCQAARLKRVLDVIHYRQPNFVVGNPHVMVQMAEDGIKNGIWPDTETLPKAAVFAIAATFDSNLKPTPVVERVYELWGIETHTSQYGCSEAGTLAHECCHHRGYHVNEADTLIELIDPDTQEPARPGSPGELVITGLSLPRGFIPIRFGTGDIAAWLDEEPCVCGRKSARFGPIIGRRDHQLKINGQTVFPELLLQLVDASHLTTRAAIGVRKNELQADEATILVVPAPNLAENEVLDRIEKLLLQSLPVLPLVRVIEEGRLQEMEQVEMQRTNGAKIPRIFKI